MLALGCLHREQYQDGRQRAATMVFMEALQHELRNIAE
jgi:hypothetical protein